MLQLSVSLYFLWCCGQLGSWSSKLFSWCLCSDVCTWVPVKELVDLLLGVSDF